jgi:hypothetical protein
MATLPQGPIKAYFPGPMVSQASIAFEVNGRRDIAKRQKSRIDLFMGRRD